MSDVFSQLRKRHKEHRLYDPTCRLCEIERERRRKLGRCEICGFDLRWETFCHDCHNREHPRYVKGCDRCETRSKRTSDTKLMSPRARAVENTKRIGILAGIVGVLVLIGVLVAAFEGATDRASDDSATDYACAAVADFASGDDVSEILSDLQRRRNQAEANGAPYGVYVSAYEVIAFGSEFQVSNWLDACSEGSAP